MSLDPRRIMTSAIDGMSVAEVRKYLGETRKGWSAQTLNQPFYITDKLSNGMTMQEFALKFQQGHHQKRHNKCRKNNKNGSTDEEEEEYSAAEDGVEEEIQETQKDIEYDDNKEVHDDNKQVHDDNSDTEDKDFPDLKPRGRRKKPTSSTLVSSSSLNINSNLNTNSNLNINSNQCNSDPKIHHKHSSEVKPTETSLMSFCKKKK
jgi:hypothetical protein